ncbi:MAG: hypothetical protein NTW94_05570 [Legionellales bacterium]|nr:hypothetical protein [Legionellales bacterium]
MKHLKKPYILSALKSIHLIREGLKEEEEGTTKRQLELFENQWTLDELEACLSKTPFEGLDQALCLLLDKRWERIRRTSMAYTENPSNKVNQFCLNLAAQLSPLPKTKLKIDDLPFNKGPYFIVMPSLKCHQDLSSSNILITAQTFI